MGVFDSQIAIAATLIAEYGEPCTWQSQAVPTIPNATEPWISVDGALTPTPVSILFITDRTSPFMQLLKGSDVEESGQKAVMAAYSFKPKADDVVIRSDNTNLVLKSATPLAPNGQVILWNLVFKA